MKKWMEHLIGDTLSWLLEEENTGVRYLALRDLMDLPRDDPELIVAREKPIEKDRSPKFWML